MDLATRAHNHGYRVDPIVRSILDTDVYKLLMAPVIARHYQGTEVEFTVICRTRDAKLGSVIAIEELREQLDHARSVALDRRERIWLAGNTFYGVKRIFDEGFLDWLEAYRLPEYEANAEHGELRIAFRGSYLDMTLWEIPALAIVSELRARAALRRLGKMSLDVLYARAKARVWEKIERLRGLPGLRIADFGTRRRHSFLWQRWCIEALMEGLDKGQLTGTSNLLHAMQCNLEAIGTNAHELPMVEAALAKDDEQLASSRYRVLDQWQESYGGNLLVLLPDTFGSTSFLQNAPSRFARWTGARVDSKDPVEAGDELISWWTQHGEDPREKLVIVSDGIGVETMQRCMDKLGGRVRLGFGWGTNLTNDFTGCATGAAPELDPISVVCKVTKVDGRPAVKLSDNPEKAIGEGTEIERYRRVFGDAGMRAARVVV